jgi:hypothetical protein
MRWSNGLLGLNQTEIQMRRIAAAGFDLLDTAAAVGLIIK